MRKAFSILVCCLFAALLTDCEKDEPVVPSTLHVETPGTLPTLIPEAKKHEITSLKLTGNLNGTDIRFIREMAGSDVNGNKTTGKLAALDLSEANIVEGGEAYFQFEYAPENPPYKTSNNNIGAYMFSGCDKLTSITIPNNVTAINYRVFQDCTSLKEFIVTSDNSNFSAVDGILFDKEKTSLISYPCERGATNYTIPDKVTSIREIAFSGCKKLTSITIPNSVTSIEENAFFNCTGLSSITIPDGVTIIKRWTFCRCIGLTSITIPDGVTSVERQAFSQCAELRSVTIGKEVTTIGFEAFSRCWELKDIFSRNPTPPTCDYYYGSFSEYSKASRTLYVPAGSLQAYKEAKHWKEFENIVETAMP